MLVAETISIFTISLGVKGVVAGRDASFKNSEDVVGFLDLIKGRPQNKGLAIRNPLSIENRTKGGGGESPDHFLLVRNRKKRR